MAAFGFPTLWDKIRHCNARLLAFRFSCIIRQGRVGLGRELHRTRCVGRHLWYNGSPYTLSIMANLLDSIKV